MKRSVFILVMMASFSWAFAQVEPQETPESTDVPQISLEETEFDFGEIHQGDKVEHVFTFTNTGNAPLVLNNVLTTCGCTAPEWPKEPIHPGESGEIKVMFNSSGKMGRQNKVITIQANIPGSTSRIKIMAMVLPPSEEESN